MSKFCTEHQDLCCTEGEMGSSCECCCCHEVREAAKDLDFDIRCAQGAIMNWLRKWFERKWRTPEYVEQMRRIDMGYGRRA